MTEPASWVDLAAVKVHLNIPVENVRDDGELGDFIRRAEAVIFTRVGHVQRLAEPVVEYREGGRSRVWLDDVPVTDVVEISVAGVVVDAAVRDAAAPVGWYLEDEHEQRAGIVRHTHRFPDGFVKVTHRPGRDPVLADLELAALEMVRYLWGTQRGGGSTHPGLRNRSSADDGEGDTDPLPPRVLELVRPYLLPERPR